MFRATLLLKSSSHMSLANLLQRLEVKLRMVFPIPYAGQLGPPKGFKHQLLVCLFFSICLSPVRKKQHISSSDRCPSKPTGETQLNASSSFSVLFFLGGHYLFTKLALVFWQKLQCQTVPTLTRRTEPKIIRRPPETQGSSGDRLLKRTTVEQNEESSPRSSSEAAGEPSFYMDAE